MLTPIAASTVSTCNSDLFQAYGVMAEKQFIQKSKKYDIRVDDVRQNAYLIYMEKKALFNPTKGEMDVFLWAHLEKLLLREALGPLRYPVYLDDNSETARYSMEQLKTSPNENTEHEDISESEIIGNPILERCRKFALSTSGKSSKELSILWGKSVRRVNQIIADWCTIARDEQLRTKK